MKRKNALTKRAKIRKNHLKGSARATLKPFRMLLNLKNGLRVARAEGTVNLYSAC